MNDIKSKIKCLFFGVVLPIIIYILITISISSIIYLFNNLKSINIIIIQGIINFVSILVLYPYYIFFKKRFIFTYSQIINTKLLYLIAVAFSLCIILNIIIGFIPRESENIVTQNVEQLTSETNVFISLFIISFLTPIIEEIIFRGFFYDSVKYVSNDIIAIILTSIVFGIFHSDFQQILYAFIVGIVFGYIRYKFNSVNYTILMHAIMNTTSLVLLPEIEKLNTIGSIIYVLIISIGILVFSFMGIINKIKH